MPVRAAIICSLCGGKYFRASLPHHQKVCARRNGVKLWECEFCGEPVPLPEKEVHVRYRCAEAPAEDVQKLEEANPEMVESDFDGREACVYCGRKFNRDRLPKHEKICANSRTRPKFNSAAQRQIDAGDGDGAFPPVPRRVSKPRKKPPPPRAPKATEVKRPEEEEVAAGGTPAKSRKPSSGPTKKKAAAKAQATATDSKQVDTGAVKAGASPGKKASVKRRPPQERDPFVMSGGVFQMGSGVKSSSSSSRASGRDGGRLGDLKPKILPSNATSADNPLATGWQC